jgi:predicted transcriptional regulator
MKTILRRDKLKIYADLLFALYSESPEEIMPTHIQKKIGVPFDRFKLYVTELVELGLVRDETSMELTEKGRQYLREYERVLDFIKRMGLEYL